jgi:hypothetical protein
VNQTKIIYAIVQVQVDQYRSSHAFPALLWMAASQAEMRRLVARQLLRVGPLAGE